MNAAVSEVRSCRASSIDGVAMKANQNKSDNFWIVFAAINFVLLSAATVLGFVSLIYSLEIVLALGAQLIIQSLGETVQAKYALVTLRNVWMLVGGILILVIIIFCIHYFFKHWHDMRVQRIYLAVLAVEALIIVAAQVLIIA